MTAPTRPMVQGDLYPCHHHRMTRTCPYCAMRPDALTRPSAMRDAVKLSMLGPGGLETAIDNTIAAVLDNLPRDAIDVFVSTYASFQGKGRYKEARAALKREVLGHE